MIVFFVSTFGQVGIILGVLEIKAKRKLNFKKLIQKVSQLYGRALKLNLALTTLPLLVPLAIAFLTAFVSLMTAGIGVICMLPLFLLLIPALFFYSFYLRIANVTLVKEGVDFRKAISNSWKLFKANWGSLAILGLILAVGTGLVSYVASLPITSTFYAPNANPSSQEIALLVASVPLLTIFFAGLISYTMAVWTLAYLEIAPTRGSTAK